jgi:hypothetical protein
MAYMVCMKLRQHLTIWNRQQTIAYLSNPITSSSVLLSVPKPPPYALRPNCLGLPQQGTATDDIPRHQKCLHQWTDHHHTALVY